MRIIDEHLFFHILQSSNFRDLNAYITLSWGLNQPNSSPCVIRRYPDLLKAFGSNYTQAIQHYVSTGHSENRTGYVEGGFPTPFGKRWMISNGHIFVSASERMGAGIDSIVWNNKQFLNAHDHGRGLQMKCNMYSTGGCFAPTEMGGRDDSNGARSTTHIVSVHSHGLTLQTKVCLF